MWSKCGVRRAGDRGRWASSAPDALDRRALEPCPICNGFIEVPDRLADWFNARICNAAAERASSGDASAAAYYPMAERPGRLAEMTYRAHLPVE